MKRYNLETFDKVFNQAHDAILSNIISCMKKNGFTAFEILKAKLLLNSFSLETVHEMFEIGNEEIDRQVTTAEMILKSPKSDKAKELFKENKDWILRDFEDVKSFKEIKFIKSLKGNSNKHGPIAYCQELATKIGGNFLKINMNILDGTFEDIDMIDHETFKAVDKFDEEFENTGEIDRTFKNIGVVNGKVNSCLKVLGEILETYEKKERKLTLREEEKIRRMIEFLNVI